MGRAAPVLLLLASLLAGCTAPAPPAGGPPAGPEGWAPRCVAEPCAQEVLAADQHTEEPTVAVDPRDAAHVVVAAPQNDNAESGARRWPAIATSTDGGATWTRGHAGLDLAGANPPLPYDIASDVALAFANDGTVLLAALVWRATPGAGLAEFTNPDLAVWRSADGGATFPAGQVVSRSLGNVSAPAVPLPRGGPATVRELDDRDVLAVDPVTGRVYLVWAHLREASTPTGYQGQTDMRLMTSDDAGATWSPPATFLEGGHYGANVAAYNGTVLAALKRYGALHHYITLRSEDGGATWSEPVELSPIPATGNYQAPGVALWPANGTLHAALALPRGDHSENLTLHRSEDGGATWDPGVDAGPGHATAKRHPYLAAEPGTLRQAVVFYDGAAGPEDGSGLDTLLLPLLDGRVAGPALRLTTETQTPGSWLTDYLGLGFGPGGGFAVWDWNAAGTGFGTSIHGAAFRVG